MNLVLSYISGLIFSIGLVVSGMINPSKVKGFLDIFGKWDYSLAFVMGGAVIFNLISFKLLGKRKPFFSETFHLPGKTKADRNSILGAIIFGAGWGLVGICPGPAIVNSVLLTDDIFIFIGSMFLGMIIYKLLEKKLV